MKKGKRIEIGTATCKQGMDSFGISWAKEVLFSQTRLPINHEMKFGKRYRVFIEEIPPTFFKTAGDAYRAWNQAKGPCGNPPCGCYGGTHTPCEHYAYKEPKA